MDAVRGHSRKVRKICRLEESRKRVHVYVTDRRVLLACEYTRQYLTSKHISFKEEVRIL